uniref:enhanced serine sensitivity protein SseB C-terminal domain-containing protein n=1 Tax=Listeria valentina TaxID=2705293 RepID=UPI001431B19A
LYGTVINPYSDNLVISRETLNFISEDSNIMKNEIVSFGIPNELPEKLMSKLTRYFTKSPVINAAFLLQLIRGKVNKSYLLVIDTSDESILKELTSFSKYLNKGEILDIVSLKSDFGKTAVEGFSPFFVKK